MEYIEGKILKGYPNPVSLKTTEIILEQMKNKVCKIHIKDEFKCTGFFCRIPYHSSLLPVLITNNHIVNESFLDNEK